MSAKKKRPEFELGHLLISQVQEYLGPRAVNKLSNDQAASIARLCNEIASAIGGVLDGDTTIGHMTWPTDIGDRPSAFDKSE